jgi:glucokinase
MADRLFIGVDLGGTNVVAAAVNERGQILSRHKKRVTKARTREELLDRVCRTIGHAIARADATEKDVVGIGIGAPGPVDIANGVVFEMPNVPVGRVDFRTELEGRFSATCLVENDVNAGTYGEFWRGAGRGKSDVVGVFVGTGTGGGIILGGKLLHGKNGTAGEIGHIVLNPGGPLCGCGRPGCLEALASRTAMQRQVAEAVEGGAETSILELAKGEITKVRSRTFRKALGAGDSLAKRVVRDCAENLGYGAVALVHLLNPECIVFGGGVMEALSEQMLPTIRQVVEERCLAGTADGVEIVPATLWDDAGVLGAAALVMEATGVTLD